MKSQKNVLGNPLRACCMQPVTGFTRTGFCELHPEDQGLHTICIVISDDFLKFSKSSGNDLSTPVPGYQFPGLKEGDKWCLCATRWKDAYDAGVAPKIVISATHESVLEIVDVSILKRYAIDL
ncbi:DUF2237 domain-containing protein [Candidatus Marinamargulisbacteria bacterium SCGC AAA071-K20]|nr:DUF2237 domain-containing protein [Candidatus Marinamargulisbacteria bacterium SCGC AAA071-K20]